MHTRDRFFVKPKIKKQIFINCAHLLQSFNLNILLCIPIGKGTLSFFAFFSQRAKWWWCFKVRDKEHNLLHMLPKRLSYMRKLLSWTTSFRKLFFTHDSPFIRFRPWNFEYKVINLISLLYTHHFVTHCILEYNSFYRY